MNFTRTATTTVTAIILMTTIAIGCSNPAVPTECVDAARQAGLPERMVEQLRNPGDLNQVEKFALRQALSQAGLDDLCGQIE